MNPAPTPGQHGHHQAAGVLATEAFDAAADPRRFPEQITREGLTTWQVRKLYYGGSVGTNGATIVTTSQRPQVAAISDGQPLNRKTKNCRKPRQKKGRLVEVRSREPSQISLLLKRLKATGRIPPRDFGSVAHFPRPPGFGSKTIGGFPENWVETFS